MFEQRAQVLQEIASTAEAVLARRVARAASSPSWHSSPTTLQMSRRICSLRSRLGLRSWRSLVAVSVPKIFQLLHGSGRCTFGGIERRTPDLDRLRRTPRSQVRSQTVVDNAEQRATSVGSGGALTCENDYTAP